ncbi:hypothetical protein MAV100_25320 [Mycobacterium avium subsp. hominissuis 100]|nr:hypothetical protein MAV100_25320 [Mycobacterium avium subsp. hominissuis 100]
MQAWLVAGQHLLGSVQRGRAGLRLAAERRRYQPVTPPSAVAPLDPSPGQA